MQVTDFDLHRMWVQSGMRGYFAASDEIAFRMAARGISRDSVHVTGIPIMPMFSRRFDRGECARELGIVPDKTTLLLMTGGAGLAGGETMTERLLELPAEFQLVALAGRNQQLLARYRGGWDKFSPAHASWHKHWWSGMPVDYWISTVIGTVLFVGSYRVKAKSSAQK